VLRAALDAIARATCSLPVLQRAGDPVDPFTTLARVLAGGAGTTALVARPRMVVDGRARRHELELWWVASDRTLGLRELGRLIGSIAPAVAPGLTISAVPASVPHAADGRHVDARVRGAWVTIATGGVADAALLRRAGLPPGASALVLTLDLDRLVMLAKGIDDPSLLVIITHLGKPQVEIGDAVHAGDSALGVVRGFPVALDQALSRYTSDAGDHLQLVALRVTPDIAGL
jgi:hypothetical protein